jgi:2,5-dihydroxypyridine 5,6-dioxygenase
MPYGRSHSSHARAVELVELFRHQLAASRLKAGELCLCITDSAWNPAYAAACMGAAHALGADAYQMVFPVCRPLPEKSLAGAWREADLIVYMTSFTLHYRPEIRAALDAGARVLCVMQPLHVLERLTADADVRARTRAGAALLDAARIIRITSDAGTDLVMDKTGRAGLAHYGAADEPGHLDFWGAGMAQAAQLEGTLEGRLVLDVGDCCFHLGRLIEQRTTIIFREGRAVAFEGGLDAFLIRSALEAGGTDSCFLAGHMAWGTDTRANWLQPLVQVPEAGGGGADTESFYGNIQIEIGSNNDVAFGGRNAAPVHLGLCILNADLSLDGRPIIERGEFVVEELRRKR